MILYEQNIDLLYLDQEVKMMQTISENFQVGYLNESETTSNIKAFFSKVYKIINDIKEKIVKVIKDKVLSIKEKINDTKFHKLISDIKNKISGTDKHAKYPPIHFKWLKSKSMQQLIDLSHKLQNGVIDKHKTLVNILPKINKPNALENFNCNETINKDPKLYLKIEDAYGKELKYEDFLVDDELLYYNNVDIVKTLSDLVDSWKRTHSDLCKNIEIIEKNIKNLEIMMKRTEDEISYMSETYKGVDQVIPFISSIITGVTAYGKVNVFMANTVSISIQNTTKALLKARDIVFNYKPPVVD